MSVEIKSIKILKFLKFMDIYGEKIQLNLKNQRTATTPVGGIMTILTIGFIMFCPWTIGKDIFFHQVPIISMEDQLFTNSPPILLDKYNLPFALLYRIIIISHGFYQITFDLKSSNLQYIIIILLLKLLITITQIVF